MIGLYHTDCELRKNAQVDTHYIIPLHTFFTTAHHNALSSQVESLQIKVVFIDTANMYISSNMIPPKHFENFKISNIRLDIECIHLSDTESTLKKTDNSDHVVQINNNIQLPIFNKNYENDISYISSLIIDFMNDISSTLALNSGFYGVYDGYIDYIEYIILQYPEYNTFHNSLLNDYILEQNSINADEPNSSIIKVFELKLLFKF